ncbi:MAG: CoA ester lyase, partial [Ramlibacter sp.]|nr:CoA ester lyase [Ramlibacter sp.]
MSSGIAPLPLTYLFVPGNRPERFDKAAASGADAIILDLEDAVAAEDKPRAREAVGQWLGGRERGAVQVLVRINDAATPWFEDELRWLAQSAPDGVMLPKAEDAAVLRRVAGRMPPGGALVPLVESARGVSELRALAEVAGVQRLAFGTIDYALDLDLPEDDRGLLYPSSHIAIESRRAGLAAPIAGVTAAIEDPARLLADWAFARATGFGAKMCIHPRQVQALRDAMRPTAAELDWARRVIDAAAASP